MHNSHNIWIALTGVWGIGLFKRFISVSVPFCADDFGVLSALWAMAVA